MKSKLLFTLLVLQLGFAQQRVCPTVEMHNAMMLSNPEYAANKAAMKELIKNEVLRLNASSYNRSTNSIKIPVAVHFPTGSEANRACLEDFAQSQVTILNNDYSGTNSDISNWNSSWSNTGGFYPGTNLGGLTFVFEIATQNHPVISGRPNGSKLVTIGSSTSNFVSSGGGDKDIRYAGYLNFVVKNLTGGILGYSPLGGLPTQGYAVVMDNNAYGSGAGCIGFVPGAPYNLGRTLTHELGHYFNLDHPFIDASGSATDCSPADQDGVDDTPKQATATYGNPVAGSIQSCEPNKKVLSMNYMDYTNDSGMYMFTANQSTISQAYYNLIVGGFKSNVLNNTNESVKNNFSVYPNPNKGNFTIQFDAEIDNCTIQIIDIFGRTVYNQDFNSVSNLQQDITLNSISKGLFFVKIKSGSGISVEKIIVE